MYNWEYFAYINTSIPGKCKYNIWPFELILARYVLNCLWHTWACAWRTWTTVCDGHLSTEPSWGPVKWLLVIFVPAPKLFTKLHFMLITQTKNPRYISEEWGYLVLIRFACMSGIAISYNIKHVCRCECDICRPIWQKCMHPIYTIVSM